MKHKTYHLYNLYYPRGWIIIALLLLFSASIVAQEQSPPGEFHIGAKLGRDPQQEDSTLNSYLECGFNGIWWEAHPDVKIWLDNKNLELLAENGRSREDYVYHYATGYYSKWEAEVDAESGRVGMKHRDNLGNLIGSYSTWQDTVSCWSSIGLTDPRDSLIYGPHYRQEKRYKRWYEEQGYDRFNLKYNVRFKMALAKSSGVLGDEDVCAIKVVYRYNKQYEDGSWDPPVDTLFLQKILKVQDFPENGNFDYFELPSYIYPSRFRPPEIAETDYMFKLDVEQTESVIYNDTEAGEGIQFWVEWLRTDNLCTLYVDNIEVYDNDGWNEYILNPEATAFKIRHYADSVSNDYDYLKYFYVHDEPYTLDAFIPYHTVEQIVMGETGIPLITEFYPYWTHDGLINGENFLQQWYDIGQPEKLMIDFYPFSPDYPFRFQDAEALRLRLQKCSELQPGFWYSAQAAGWYDVNNNPVVWRQPDSSEFKSTVMLALAHGITGIELFSYTTFGNDEETYTKGIVENRGTKQFARNDLWYHLKEGLIPRLHSNLGQTLMNLEYSSNYIQLQREENQESPPPVEYNYLHLSPNPNQTDLFYNWHCGFFDSTGHPQNKYFLLTNLITTVDRHIRLTVSSPVSGYANYRFRNVEGYFDETFQEIIVKDLTYIKGEGYLYQVAPVVLYGGKIIYNEYAGEGLVLSDDMSIENGVTLGISEVYTANADITVKNGSITNAYQGEIHFGVDNKLIVDGICTISGTSNDKLRLIFSDPLNDDSTGILVKAGGSLTINNCTIENASIGIQSLLNASSLNIQNVDFIDCEDHSISIAGQGGGMGPTPAPQISYCTMENSLYGISASNLSSILIRENEITDTDCGIFLSNVTDAQIIGNEIESTNEQLQGIYSSSTGGVFRGNIISGHSVGVHLANSSPKLGGNIITANKYNGIYIGSGSVPYMRGEYLSGPPVAYALSGYNTIYENGGWQELDSPDNNDGSEIYFNYSSAVLDSGCNSIYDDRQVSAPLINTLLLMSGNRFGFPTLQATNNFWGDTVYAARFGTLSVNYIPYASDPCPVPYGSEEEQLVMMNQFGVVIDTVYSTGLDVPALSEIELDYAEAEEYYLTGDLTSALQLYEYIISSGATDEEKYLAYERKYMIGRLNGESSEFFNSLNSAFSNLASNSQDSLTVKRLRQLATLSKVGEQEYETAIGEFDGIVQQNPNTEDAVYAEIDALTTALLVEGSDSTLQKGRLGKYLVKSFTNYHQKVDEILRKNFGSNSTENAREILPTEYTLYQNYPNPFNPATTIKYDLPDASDVSLIIYDILGRKVKELVNSKQPAGRYEIQFNASNLASGVYIYQLIADKYISSKKMILLK